MRPAIPNKGWTFSNRLNWKQQQRKKKSRVLTIWSLKSAFPAYSGHFSPSRKSKFFQWLIPFLLLQTNYSNELMQWRRRRRRRAGRVFVLTTGLLLFSYTTSHYKWPDPTESKWRNVLGHVWFTNKIMRKWIIFACNKYILWYLKCLWKWIVFECNKYM